MLRKLWVALVVVMALACTAAQPAAQAPGADDQPRYGGTFNVSTTTDPFDFDFSYTGSNSGAVYVREAYMTLLRLKTGPDIGFSEVNIEPLLAERWEVTSDAKTSTFHLRKGVKYADLPPVNGREITAADVKFSFEYTSRTGEFAKLSASTFAYMFEGLESIQTPDPYTVVVKFKEGFAPFLSYAASSDNPIMPREIYGQDGHFKDRVVGSGPFQLDVAASLPNSRLVMKKNPTYFEEGRPYLDQVHHLVVTDEATRLAAFVSKQIDYYGGTVDAQVAEEVKRTVPNAVEYGFASTPRILALNFQRPPLNDLRVRKAISLAIDRDELIKIAGGRGEWAVSMTNIFTDLFTQQEIKSIIKQDPEEARRLLQQAGYSQGLQLELIFNAEGADSRAAQLYQAQLKKVGINIVLAPLESAEVTRRRRAKALDLLVLVEAQRIDLDGQLFLASYTGGGFNYNNISDSKADAMILAQRSEVDPAKRREILRELIRYLNESGLQIPTYRVGESLLWHPYVKGFFQSADRRTQGVKTNVWLAKS